MNASTSSASESLPETPDVDKAKSNSIEQTIPKHSHQIENDFERIQVLRRTVNFSFDRRAAWLTSELQELQTLLNSEVKRVQGEIESALSGIQNYNGDHCSLDKRAVLANASSEGSDVVLRPAQGLIARSGGPAQDFHCVSETAK